GKKALSFSYRATLRVGMPFWTLRVLCVALRVIRRFARSIRYAFDSRHLFAPRRVTLKDQSNQNPGSVSVTYATLCVVSAIAIKKRFYVQ
ncbi:hypothetical protein, partial [Pseudomonas syringae group genomosp. 3]|uniref:hypothetical protein n=1 Tax=Pseudomonas syringae group genomosp. 3 TaxID=251701 RepID=UPI00217FF747